jgi:NADP-dependent 3-hydroxy acid dehydrogenase YdfG
VALTELTRLLFPGMLARRRGKVMLLTSTAAFQPGPRMALRPTMSAAAAARIGYRRLTVVC